MPLLPLWALVACSKVKFICTKVDKYDPQYLMVSQTTSGNFHGSDGSPNPHFTTAQYDSRRKCVFLSRFHDSALCKEVQPSTRLFQWRSLCHGHRYTVSPFGVAFRGTDCIRKARDGCIKIRLVAYDAVWFPSCQGCGGERYLHFQGRRTLKMEVALYSQASIVLKIVRSLPARLQNY